MKQLYERICYLNLSTVTFSNPDKQNGKGKIFSQIDIRQNIENIKTAAKVINKASKTALFGDLPCYPGI